MSIIIGFIGDYPGVGKDTITEYLAATHQFICKSFAAKLYSEVSAAFGVSIAEISRRDLKETSQDRFALYKCKDLGFVNLVLKLNPDITLNTPLSPRFILRTWGTEYRRNRDSDYWASPVFKDIDSTPGRYAISDTRFENEIVGVAERGGVIVRIKRPSVAPEKLSDHPSEVFARNWKADAEIENEGTLQELYPKIELTLKALNIRL